ncbi:MAG: (2Fe-2S) ferredoxin domain-containing protein [Verrucomicrobiales bacterium]|jgi:(2Fe-2S) ferredoxin|nr:(2Fe-2S) ferredoxin domain-containing protein [Verrucomicrobiales bacterium]
MNKPDHHILVCGSFRNGAVSGVCNKQAAGLFQYLTEEAEDRGLNVMVSNTGCLNLCVHGPVVIVYPEGRWFKQVTEEVADAILDSLDGEVEVPEANVLAA